MLDGNEVPKGNWQGSRPLENDKWRIEGLPFGSFTSSCRRKLSTSGKVTDTEASEAIEKAKGTW